MDTVDLSPLLEQLEDNINDLEDTLEPLLKNPLSETAAKLPLLDRAKLYVSITYAVESILFSFLRLNGVNAKEHPVFRELTRLKQYFEKIKIAEAGEVKRDKLSLDKPAAGRIIKHALAGNDKYDLQRAEQLAKEKARAHIIFGQVSKKRKLDDRDEVPATSTKTSSGNSNSNSNSSSSSSSSESESDDVVPVLVESKPATVETTIIDQPPKKKRNRIRKKHRHGPQAAGEAGVEDGATGIAEITNKKRKSKKRRKQLKEQPTEGGNDAAGEEETIIPSKTSQPPLEHSATFQALLKGPLPKRDKGKPKSKKRQRKGEGQAGDGD